MREQVGRLDELEPVGSVPSHEERREREEELVHDACLEQCPERVRARLRQDEPMTAVAKRVDDELSVDRRVLSQRDDLGGCG